MRSGIFSVLAAILLVGGPAVSANIQGSTPVKGLNEQDYAAAAKITMSEAIDAALSKAEGRAVEAELDDEDGYLVYEVKVSGPDRKVTKVIVDAGNREVLRTERN